MKNRKQYIVIFTFIVSLMLFPNLNCFSQKIDFLNLDNYKVALKFFNKKQYHEAVETFSHLLSLEPNDALLNYYYGVCLVETNKHINLSQEYLKIAITGIVPANAYFYLARSYHLTYQFDKAKVYYEKFLQKAKRKDAANFETIRQIEMCQNGMEITKSVKKLKTIKNVSIKNDDFFRAYRINFSGKFTPKPKEFFSINEKLRIKSNQQYQNEIIFYSEKSDIIYYSSWFNRSGLDIVVKQKLKKNKWTQTQKLSEIINTKYDDAFPFLHTDGKTLYFSSKGHNSMGGYDIFKTTFDSVENTWSEPTNLNFPINTPHDDFLFVLNNEKNTATFASNRMTDKTRISVFTISLNENSEKLRVNGKSLIAISEMQFIDNTTEKILTNTNYTTTDNSIEINAVLDSLKIMIIKFNYYHDFYKTKEYELKGEIENQSNLHKKSNEQFKHSKTENEKSQTEKLVSTLKTLTNNCNILSRKIRNEIIELKEIENAFIKKNSNKDILKFVENPAKLLLHLNSQNNDLKYDYRNFVKQLNFLSDLQKPIVKFDTVELDTSMYFVNFDSEGNLVPSSRTKLETNLECFFVVQMGVYIKDIKKEVLQNIKPVIVETLPNGQKRYSTGVFSDFETAEKKRNEIANLGTQDAYIKAILHGKKTTIENANIFLNKNEIDTFAKYNGTIENINDNQVINKNKIVFRIQIGVYKETFDIENYRLKFEKEKKYQLSYFKTNQKTYVFLKNQFQNFNDATTFKNEARNNGIKDAFIVAFQGDKKISIDEAKRLITNK
ncbi:MAG: hypothetical protein HN704_09225 [Bacteroidetes bacterium]|jgi:tetratricopeptide (TPR) repeat protein|nr:hypothetical protein [Bacteroidota bacterium]MBT6685072.1 hypothetical protein [Bacteroidota bacterium]MBT7144561.1 hypothetical protein [Bacteroidota bacterium]MBT7491774.1 hypothetical protein [Bacteroidota bacterium]